MKARLLLLCSAALQIRPGMLPSAATLSYSLMFYMSRVSNIHQVYIKDFQTSATLSRSTE